MFNARKKSLLGLSDEGLEHGSGLNKVLSLKDLTFFGIAAIIGAGSFSSLGEACFKGGPGVIILFIIVGTACAFTAFCYAEFASRVTVSGSAYTYAYVSFGELVAWIIGWALLMEYSIGNIYVAYSWSDYFCSFLDKLGDSLHINLHIPDYLRCSYLEAKKLAAEIKPTDIATLTESKKQVLNAWNNAPNVGGLKLIADLPAFCINLAITYLVFKGVKESKNFSNLMVIIKLLVVAMVIIVGASCINIINWTPPAVSTGLPSFMPTGFNGVMGAVSSVFFAYIGFDAVSVLAEESKNPQRDLPRGMLLSLVICTVIYILLALVLTGAVPYKLFENVGDPLAKIFEIHNMPLMQMLVSVCAVIAMTSVLLVFQMGQPRIWMSMSRDGLLPKAFQKIHPTYKTPSFSTWLTGAIVGIPLFFTDKNFVLDFTSIGTLFAFLIVCAGVLFLPPRPKEKGKFHLPFISSRFIFPVLVLGAILFAVYNKANYFTEILAWHSDNACLNITTTIFWLIILAFSILGFVRQLSLIPLMGVATCSYLLTYMSASNWQWFFIWFGIGIIVYYTYGYKNSKLNKQN
jgi:basic amino acid/polyamine antiporter, APA family